jgi:hypothetical protein
MAVVRDGAAFIVFLVALKEFVGKIVDEFGNLFLLPLVFALVIVNRVLMTGEKLSNCAALTINGS